MITVNLLPHHLRPIKRTPVPHMLSVLVLAGVFAGIAYVFVSGLTTLQQKNAKLETVLSELAELKDTVDEYNQLTKIKEDLQSRIGVIQEILQDRTIWSEELNRLAHLTPDNIWYSSIGKQHIEYQSKLDPKTKKTTRVAVRSMRPVLQVSGYAISDETGIPSVTPLTERTSGDPEFSSRFELLPATTSDTLFNSFPVRSFTMQYWITSSAPPQETP